MLQWTQTWEERLQKEVQKGEDQARAAADKVASLEASNGHLREEMTRALDGEREATRATARLTEEVANLNLLLGEARQTAEQMRPVAEFRRLEAAWAALQSTRGAPPPLGHLSGAAGGSPPPADGGAGTGGAGATRLTSPEDLNKRAVDSMVRRFYPHMRQDMAETFHRAWGKLARNSTPDQRELHAVLSLLFVPGTQRGPAHDLGTERPGGPGAAAPRARRELLPPDALNPGGEIGDVEKAACMRRLWTEWTTGGAPVEAEVEHLNFRNVARCLQALLNGPTAMEQAPSSVEWESCPPELRYNFVFAPIGASRVITDGEHAGRTFYSVLVGEEMTVVWWLQTEYSFLEPGATRFVQWVHAISKVKAPYLADAIPKRIADLLPQVTPYYNTCRNCQRLRPSHAGGLCTGPEAWQGPGVMGESIAVKEGEVHPDHVLRIPPKVAAAILTQNTEMGTLDAAAAASLRSVKRGYLTVPIGGISWETAPDLPHTKGVPRSDLEKRCLEEARRSQRQMTQLLDPQWEPCGRPRTLWAQLPWRTQEMLMVLRVGQAVWDYAVEELAHCGAGAAPLPAVARPVGTAYSVVDG